ncbi:MAG: OmpA family protein [Deltaproteobacteria bacterium]|nr:MAG: OmpA family protein [Deltaproteobacteria bacterium]
MNRKLLVLMIMILVLIFTLSGCVVSAKKYKKLEADYQELKKGFDEANLRLDEKDRKIEELERMLEKQKVASEREIALAEKTNEELVASLKKEISSEKIEVARIRGRLTMSVVEELFFESGKAEIKPGGKDVFRRIGGVLKKVPEKNVRVEGHTDNVPIGPKMRERYPTNWELGAARAVNVVRFLQEDVGMDPLRLSAVSYGHYRPKATNRTVAGRVKNRRIEIILINRDLDLAKKMRERLVVK